MILIGVLLIVIYTYIQDSKKKDSIRKTAFLIYSYNTIYIHVQSLILISIFLIETHLPFRWHVQVVDQPPVNLFVLVNSLTCCCLLSLQTDLFVITCLTYEGPVCGLAASVRSILMTCSGRVWTSHQYVVVWTSH